MRQSVQKRQGQTNRWSWLLSQGLLLSIGAAIVLAHEGHAPLPTKGVEVDVKKGVLILAASSRDALDVQTVEVQSRPVEEQTQAYATLVAPWQRHAFVTSRLPGKIVRLHVRPGDPVAADTVLAEIESVHLESFQAEVLNTALAALLSELVQEIIRASGLAVPGQNLLDAETKHKQNLNALEVARMKWAGLGLEAKDLDALLKRATVDRKLTMPIRSPLAGQVIHADSTVGRVVKPADHLFEVVDHRTVWARIDVLERDLHRVQVGQKIELRLAAYPGEVFPNIIRAQSHSLDPTTHLAQFWAELENPPKPPARFLPGMTGEVQIRNQMAKSAKVIPGAALVEDGLDRYVLVEESGAEAASEYRKRSVVVVRRSQDWVQIESDHVYPGDRVVTQGTHELATYFVPGVLKLTPETVDTIKLKVEPAKAHPIEEVVALDGAVEVPPDRRTHPAAQLEGTLEKIHVDRGQRVSQGELLAEVFSQEFQNLQLALIKESLETSLLDQQYQSLIKLGDVTSRRGRVELESALAASKNRQACLRQQLEILGLLPEQLDGLVQHKKLIPLLPVRATADGTVVHFDRALGQTVQADEKIFTIHDLERPWIIGYVSERNLGKVKLDQNVRVRLNSDPGLVLTGKIVRLGGVLDEESRTMSAWVELDKPAPRSLLHQQLARLTVRVRAGSPTLAVPVSALVQDGTRYFVFVRQDDGSFERVPVEPGPRADDQFIEIVSGLVSGTPIAIQGTSELQTAYAAIR